MAKQTFPLGHKSKIHRASSRKLPEVTRQSEIVQDNIDVWLEKARQDRDYPGVQARLAQLTALYWQGRQPSSEYVHLFGEFGANCFLSKVSSEA